MKRPAYLENALELIRSYREKARTARPRLPVFWLAGPFGSGKSVLLLQVMRELVLRGEFDSANYLGEFVRCLPSAVAYWSRTSQPGLIIIDDAFAPENREPQIWLTVAETVFRREWRLLPLLFTCGPREQFRAFRDEVNRYSEIELVEIPVKPMPMEEDERIAHHSWYQNRTGACLPLSREPIMIAAAWIYELRRRANLSPEQFAFSFENRLRALGLFDAAFAAMALNQYGLEAPDRLFAGREDSLDQLISEKIYRLANPTLDARHGRFFHPSIAHVIYNARVAADAFTQRAYDLARGFAAMLERAEAANAFVIWLEAPRTQSLLDPRLKRETLRALWAAFQNCGPDHNKVIPLLMRWHAMAHAEIDVGGIGARSAIRAWYEAASHDDQSWGLLFQMVWDDGTKSERDVLFAAGVQWLTTNDKDGAWSFIWRRL